MPFLANFLPGYGAVSVSSLAVAASVGGNAAITGNAAVTGAAVITGNVTGAQHIATTDTLGFTFSSGTTIGVSKASSTLALVVGNTNWVTVGTGEVTVVATADFIAAGLIETRGRKRSQKRTVDITTVGQTIVVTGQSFIEVNLSAGAIISTAAPFIADGVIGDEIILMNFHATNTLTLADDGATSSNLRLRAATRVLAAAGGYLELHYSSTSGLWQESRFG